MNKTVMTNNTKATLFTIIASLVSGAYGIYMLWNYYLECQNIFSTEENMYMIVGLLCEAAMMYGFYAADVMRKQSLEITEKTISGTGMAPGFLVKAAYFTYPMTQIESANVTKIRGQECLKLMISGEGAVFAAIQDPAGAAASIEGLLQNGEN